VQDPNQDALIDVIVQPAAHLDGLDEVLVITATEPRFSPQEQQDLATSEAVKGEEVEALNEQKKASAIMAEKLPGLIDPNLPPDKQPLLDSSLPTIPSHPPAPIHPDRFTAGASDQEQPGGQPVASPKPSTEAEPAAPATGSPKAAKPAAKPAIKLDSPGTKPDAKQDKKPGRNP
jgi:rod shape-determining protein MreC